MPPEHLEEARETGGSRVEQLANNFAAAVLTRLPQLSHDFDDFSSFDSRSSLISLSPIFVTPL